MYKKERNMLHLHSSMMKLITAFEPEEQLTLCTMLMADVISNNFAKDAHLRAAAQADRLLRDQLEQQGAKH